MRFFLSVFGLFVLFLSATPTNKCVSIDKFSASQKEIIAYAYNYGEKYNLGYVLAAIAWHESCAGEYRMNFADPSAGIYHALIPGIIKRYKMGRDSGFNRNRIGELLVRDDEFASKAAIDELLYWDKVREGNLKKIIKSYNKGFSWEKSHQANEFAENYYKNIQEKIDILQEYLPKNLSKIEIKKREPMSLNFIDTANLQSQSTQSKEVAIEKIRKVEVKIFENDDINIIKQAKESNKAVISIYSKNEDSNTSTHKKTIILRSFYVEKK